MKSQIETKEDILKTLTIEGPMKDFFESYIDNNNELQSLVENSLTVQDLKDFRSDKDFQLYKDLIDVYYISTVEARLQTLVEENNFKAIEFILKNRSEKYANVRNQNVTDMGSLIDESI